MKKARPVGRFHNSKPATRNSILFIDDLRLETCDLKPYFA